MGSAVPRFRLLPVSVFCVLAIACGGSSSNPTPPPPPGGPGDGNRIETTIGTAGGSVSVTTTGHPYRGLRLTVPAATFPTPVTFTFDVVSNPVLPQLPAGFRVSGPVLSVTSTGGMGSDLMTLRVPTSHGPNEQVLLAFYDPGRRVTELLPTIYRDDTVQVALVSHLRPDLMLGPGLASVRLDDPVGWLFPVAYQLPLADVGSVLGNASRWPVLDYGSASHPDGFGAAIPAIQSIAAAAGQSLAQLEPGLATPGFYGDGAQLAAVTRAAQTTAAVSQKLARVITASTGIIQQQGNDVGKPQLDELANHLIVAALAISRKPLPVALMRGDQAADAVVVTAVSGTNNTVGVLAAAAQSVASLTRQSAGFVQVAVQAVGGGPPVSVDRAIPLSSFVTDFKAAATAVQRLVQVSSMAAGSAARAAATKAMLVEAGVPVIATELEAATGTGFVATGDDPVVVRSETARLRIPMLGGASTITIQVRGGGPATETDGAALPLKEIAAVAAAANLQPTDVVISLVRMVGGVARQVTASAIRVVKAPFDVTPTDAKLSELFTRIPFTASVPEPPSGGYGIEWDWGDGHFLFQQNSTTATIEFVEVKDYKVIATLVALPGQQVLGVDTVEVLVDQAKQWRLLSVTDADGMFDDPDVDIPGSSPMVQQLQRMLAAPSSTLLSVDYSSVNTNELLLKTLMNQVWSQDACCPPPAPETPRLLILGRDPTESYALGPYFADWGSSFWSQSSTDLGTGTMMSQHIFGTHVYNIDDQNQVGPAGGVRMVASRLGKSMSGTIAIFIWFVDTDGDLIGPPDVYHFPFTAGRVR